MSKVQQAFHSTIPQAAPMSPGAGQSTTHLTSVDDDFISSAAEPMAALDISSHAHNMGQNTMTRRTLGCAPVSMPLTAAWDWSAWAAWCRP